MYFPVFVNTWLIELPDPAEYPVVVPFLDEAVQVNVELVTLDVIVIPVFALLHIVLYIGELFTAGSESI